MPGENWDRLEELGRMRRHAVNALVVELEEEVARLTLELDMVRDNLPIGWDLHDPEVQLDAAIAECRPAHQGEFHAGIHPQRPW
jgi:hypothetical protein